jgi:hypothetical protein
VHQHLKKLILPITALVLTLPLIAHVYLGQFNRLLSDDFCFTVVAREHGLLGSLDHWYNNWTGTYSSTFFQSSIGLLEAWRFTPIVLTILWFIALTFTLYQVTLYLKMQEGFVLGVCVSAVVLASTINGTHNTYQSLYWTSGAITYSGPLIVLTLNVGVILWGLRSSHRLIPFLALSAGLCMLAGGFSPLFAVAQVASWSLAFVGVLLLAPSGRKRDTLLMLGSALVFIGIAFLILLIAPGNDVRRFRFPDTPSLMSLIGFTLDQSRRFLDHSITSIELFVAPVLVGAVAAGFLTIRKVAWIRLALLIAFLGLSAFVIIAACLFTAAYAMTYAPPPRSYIVPRYALLIALLGIGFIVSVFLFRLVEWAWAKGVVALRVALAFATLVLMFIAVNSALDTFNTVPRLRTYAEEWDALDTRLQSAPSGGEVVVDRLSVEFAEMAQVNRITVREQSNTCVADFYDLSAVRASN